MTTLLGVFTRMSTLFLRTLRDDPADAEVPSHKLLVRAGYVRRVAPGIYSWLPLGLKVLKKIASSRSPNRVNEFNAPLTKTSFGPTSGGPRLS